MRRVLFFLFLNILTIYSQRNVDSLLLSGVRYSDNLQFRHAENAFNEFIKENSDLPDGYYFLSQLYFWQYLANRDSANYLIFMKYVNIAEELSSNAKLETSAWENFIAGSVHAIKAAAFSTYGKNMKAFFETKKAVSLFQNAIALDSSFADPYYGLGVFNYALSYLPGIMKFALDITGLEHNKDRAIVYLKKSLARGMVTRDESAFNLSKIYLEYLGELDSAEYYINIALRRNSNNILFSYQKAIIKIKRKNLNRAEKILEEIVNSGNKNFKQTRALSYFLLGEIHFYENDFKNAIKYYEKFFETTSTIDYIGFASLRTALAAKFVGSDSIYYENITTSNFGNSKIPDDKFAEELGNYLLKNGTDKGFLNVIKALNYFKAGLYRRGLTFCDSVISGDKLNKYSVDLEILKGAFLTELGRYSASNKILANLNGAIFLREIVAPIKYISLIKNNWFLGKKKSAEEYFLKLKSFDFKYFKHKYEGQINYFARHLFRRK